MNHPRLMWLLPVVLASPLNAQAPLTPTPLSNGRGDDLGGIAVDGSRVVAFWCNNRKVNVAVSNDCGQTWGPETRVDTGPLAQKEPVSPRREGVRMHGDHIYLSWFDVRAGSFLDPELYFGRSVDGGVTWSEQILDFDLEGSVELEVVRDPITPTQDTVHVLFPTAIAPNAEDLLLRTSTDGGATFGPPTIVVPTTGSGTADLWGHAMHVEGDRVSVLWAENLAGVHSVNFRQSSDGGVTWAAAVQVGSGGFVTFGSPALAREGDLIAAAWLVYTGGSNEVLYVSVSRDGGLTFDPGAFVGNYSSETSDVRDAVVGVSNGNVLCLWGELRGGGNYQPFVSTSTDGGLSFTETSLAPGTGVYGVRMQTRGQRVVTTRTQYTLGDATVSQYSDDGGLTWTSPLVVSALAVGNSTSAVAIGDGDDVQIAWGVRDSSFSQGEMFVGGYRTTAAAVTNRTAGTNVSSYVASPPVLGNAWSITVDLSSTGHALAVARLQTSPATIMLPNGESFLLGGARIFETPLLAGPIGQFTTTLPADVCLSGRQLFSQAVHLGGLPPALTNAQDLTVGTF